MGMTIPKQEKRFDYKGFPCVILFMPMGYRCGYVGVPHYYQSEINTDEIECHCGVTYAETHLHCQTDTDKLWIGFECGHYCDGYDVAKIKELYADDENVMKQTEIMKDYFAICNEENPIRTLEYCEEQCRGIVEQLIKLGIKMEV